jgi:rubrerythrin
MTRFNADEIFEMAEQIERNGARFYRKAAGAAEADPRDKLLKLAAMEDDHEKTFAGMRAELGARQRQPPVPDLDDESALYLQAMVDGEVFSDDPAEALTGRETLADVLRTAIGLEKDSIVFYEGLKGLVVKDAGKQQVERIIREEMGHVALLTRELASAR